eukprot:COSAG02_NODE_4379_length_5427_cov_7.176989_1_plen_1290_part_00
MSGWANSIGRSVAEAPSQDADTGALDMDPTATAWGSTQMASSGHSDAWSDSWSDSQGSWPDSPGSDMLWLGMDCPCVDELTDAEAYNYSLHAGGTVTGHDSSLDSDSRYGGQLTDSDTPGTLSDSGSEVWLEHNAPVGRTPAAQVASINPKPLRMTVPAGHRAGDVCYAQVQSSGQRVAGRIPPGLGPGDQFLVLYRPQPQGGGSSNVLSMEVQNAEVAMQRARLAPTPPATPPQPLTVEEIVGLLRESTWAGGDPPPLRPLRLQDATSDLFREPRTHKRRQKKSVGAIDRWRNSGGKRALVTLDIPPALRPDGSNVLVNRHGKVIQVDGLQARYQQWTFGTLLENGDVKEQRGSDQNVLFQVSAETAEHLADTPGLANTPEPWADSTEPSADAPEPPPPRPAGQLHPQLAQPQAFSPGPAEVDFNLLGHSVAKRTFEEPLFADGLPKKKRFAGLYAGVAALAILGVVRYTAGDDSSDGANPPDEDYNPLPKVTCSGTPENLLHANASSVLSCKQKLGQECPLLCEPGYGPYGNLSCGYDISALDGDAACRRCPAATFSEAGTGCKPCSPCSGVKVATCTPTTDNHCVAWNGHLDLPPNNQTQPWHLPQFAAVWGDASTIYAFGGRGSATPSQEVSDESAACSAVNAPLSNELWTRDSSQAWSLVGGSVARSSHGETFTPIGVTGWPAPRSSAASWSIPSEMSAQNVLIPSAVLFSGSFLAPCGESTAVDHRSLLNPSDLWVYGHKHEASGVWMLVGGEQKWAEPPDGDMLSGVLMEGQMTLPNVGGDLTQSSAVATSWPLGRHDAHTWVVGGALLMFSGAMDWHQRAAGLAQTSKRACLLNDYWLLHIREESITWENGGGLEKGSIVAPRPRQPGPRVFGATWTAANTTSGADVAWLFGGIGSTYCAGEGSWGSAVAAPADRLLDADAGGSADCALHTMCDLWAYSPPSHSIGVAESPWKLVWACALDIPLLNEHSDELGMPGQAHVGNLALTEAVLASTWVDSDQNLWLFGGAECRDVPDSRQGCASVVKDALNPRRGRRQLQGFQGHQTVDISGQTVNVPLPGSNFAIPTGEQAGADAFQSEGLTPGGRTYLEEHSTTPGAVPLGPTAPAVNPTPNYAPGPPGSIAPALNPTPNYAPGTDEPWTDWADGYNNYSPPPPPPGNTAPPYPASPAAGTQGDTTVIPCMDELWRFDTVAMEWSSFRDVQGGSSSTHGVDSAVAPRLQWPAGECGASAIPSRTAGAGSSTSELSELVGGWNVRAFATCGSDIRGAGADCSGTSWLLGPEQP